MDAPGYRRGGRSTVLRFGANVTYHQLYQGNLMNDTLQESDIAELVATMWLDGDAILVGT